MDPVFRDKSGREVRPTDIIVYTVSGCFKYGYVTEVRWSKKEKWNQQTQTMQVYPKIYVRGVE